MEYKLNDVFNWRYTQSYIDELSSDRDLYWAKSKICIFDGAIFRDTFWGNDYSTCFSYDIKDIGTKIEIIFLGNLDDYDNQGDYSQLEDLIKYYKKSDILNLNHSNSSRGNLYLKKGAIRDLDIIKAGLEVKRSDILNDIDYQTNQLKDINNKINDLAPDKLDDIYY